MSNVGFVAVCQINIGLMSFLCQAVIMTMSPSCEYYVKRDHVIVLSGTM